MPRNEDELYSEYSPQMRRAIQRQELNGTLNDFEARNGVTLAVIEILEEVRQARITSPTLDTLLAQESDSILLAIANAISHHPSKDRIYSATELQKIELWLRENVATLAADFIRDASAKLTLAGRSNISATLESSVINWMSRALLETKNNE